MLDASVHGPADPVPDTIAAVATAPGPGAVALVRVSGPRAADILRAVAPALTELPPPRRATVARVVDPTDGSTLDRAVVVRYAAPASYTGEELVEISCHGGALVPRLVLEACLASGARAAEPGEFTRRAYLHGKLDLVQVEAVADVVEARSRALHRAAVGQLERGLSARVGELRQRLVRLEALLAHHLDFPEEDDAPVPLSEIVEEADAVLERMDALLATAPEGALLREGAVTVLAGRPNVGKSSLYNALLGEERALVTEVAGTTRDALESPVQMGGYPFRLVDTAGLRESADRVERLGIEVARRALARADLILLCVDEEMGREEERFLEEGPHVPVVLVRTKADLRDAAEGGPGTPGHSRPGVEDDEVREKDGRVEKGGRVAARVSVSVRTGEGLDRLRHLLPELVYAGLVEYADEAPVLTRRRQAEALRTARREVAAFRAALADGVPAEMAGTHLRPAETALEEILGVISVEDVLDVLFASFCIGK